MYYRFTRKDNPMSDYGHAMFAEDRDRVCDGYGRNEYLYDGKGAVDIEDLRDIIIKNGRRMPNLVCSQPDVTTFAQRTRIIVLRQKI